MDLFRAFVMVLCIWRVARAVAMEVHHHAVLPRTETDGPDGDSDVGVAASAPSAARRPRHPAVRSAYLHARTLHVIYMPSELLLVHPQLPAPRVGHYDFGAWLVREVSSTALMLELAPELLMSTVVV